MKERGYSWVPVVWLPAPSVVYDHRSPYQTPYGYGVNRAEPTPAADAEMNQPIWLPSPSKWRFYQILPTAEGDIISGVLHLDTEDSAMSVTGYTGSLALKTGAKPIPIEALWYRWQHRISFSVEGVDFEGHLSKRSSDLYLLGGTSSDGRVWVAEIIE